MDVSLAYELAMTAYALEIERLVKSYGQTRAVDDLQLNARPGEILGLLGPNGAGKSTTIGICTTRIIATAGRVRVCGIDVMTDPALAKRCMGVVTQYNTLDRSCTVIENLYYHARYFGLTRPEARKRSRELLERVRLRDRSEALPDELSGGMAQRLQVARAVSHRPQVLFLDEPTAGLDPQSRLALWELVRELRAAGTTVLLTTHNMDEADQLCDRVAIIDHGRILVCDAPERIRRGSRAQTSVEVTVDPPYAELLERLRALQDVTRVEETPSGLRVLTQRADGNLQRVVEAARGSELRDIAVSAPTLETVFIELTGRVLRD